LYVGFPDEEGRVNVLLHPHELQVRYDPEKERLVPSKGRAVTLAEVRSTASALDRIGKELDDLWRRLEERHLPEEERSDYVPPEEE
jgi:hypothetical protein